MSRWVDVGALDEMKFDPGHPVHLDGRWLAVFPHQGSYRVIDNACPHASAPLCDGTLLDGKGRHRTEGKAAPGFRHLRPLPDAIVGVTPTGGAARR